MAYNLEDKVDSAKIIDVQKHHTPFYSQKAFTFRNEVIETNGENHTFHAGAYLGDGLHEGAITSDQNVSKRLGGHLL